MFSFLLKVSYSVDRIPDSALKCCFSKGDEHRFSSHNQSQARHSLLYYIRSQLSPNLPLKGEHRHNTSIWSFLSSQRTSSMQMQRRKIAARIQHKTVINVAARVSYPSGLKLHRTVTITVVKRAKTIFTQFLHFSEFSKNTLNIVTKFLLLKQRTYFLCVTGGCHFLASS